MEAVSQQQEELLLARLQLTLASSTLLTSTREASPGAIPKTWAAQLPKENDGVPS